MRGDVVVIDCVLIVVIMVVVLVVGCVVLLGGEMGDWMCFIGFSWALLCTKMAITLSLLGI